MAEIRIRAEWRAVTGRTMEKLAVCGLFSVRLTCVLIMEMMRIHRQECTHMARLSIYVPDELKARIDTLKSEANWSEVACRAFEVKIGELAKVRKEQDMSAVIERLRASKIEHEDTSTKDGRETGRAWAQSQAEYAELRRVAEMDADEWTRGEPLAPWRRCDYVAFHILGFSEDIFNDTDAEEFWGDDSDCGDDDYLKGFILGAQEVYEEIANRI